MLYVGVGIVGLILLVGGAFVARKEYYASKPGPIWVPLTLTVGISMEEQNALADQIDERLRDDDLLRQIVIDADLQNGFNQPTEEAAIEELKRRLFAKAGSADTPQGSVPSVNVGVTGTRREHEVLERAAKRIIKDVWRMMGIDPDTGKPLQKPGSAPIAPPENP